MTGDRKRDVDRVRNTLTSAVNLEKVIRSTKLGDETFGEKVAAFHLAGFVQ